MPKGKTKNKSLKKRREEKRQKRARLVGLFFVCFLLICGIIYYMMSREVNKVPKDRAGQGILVGQVDVAGMTAKEAKDAVDQKAAEYGQQVLTFKSGELSASVTLAELGFDIEKEEELIKEAVEYVHSGNVFARYSRMKKLKEENKVFQPVYAVNDETATKVLQEKLKGVLPGAADASIRRENGAFVITDEVKGIELDAPATIKEIRTFLNSKWDGKAGNIEIISQTQQPKVTRADLEVIKDKLGSFSTYCGSGQSRVTNIINGAKLINGKVLMPGEEFSAGKTMQPFTRENGYVEAGAFENGEVVQSLAGGICQVSTTLYNAVINAELEVTSRQPHSMTVAYVKPSRDAAIAGDYKDFRFKNNGKTPIFIEGYVSGGNVVFNIYGKETRPAGRTIEFISETLSTTPTKKKYVESGAAIGTIKEAGGAHKGLTARLWKVVYENGKEVSRDIFNKSAYIASAQNVEVGVSSSNPEYTKIMRAAIKSQNEATIKAAIAKVKALEAEAAKPKPPVTPPTTPPETPPATTPPAAEIPQTQQAQ